MRSRGLVVVGAALVGLMVLTAVAAPLLARYDPAAQGVGPAFAGPSAEHWLGTDRFGRDVASRVLHGGRTTLVATAAALVLVVTVGVGLGAVVAVLGSTVDRAARYLFDLLAAFPVMVVALAMVGLWGPSLGAALAGVLVVLWAPFARLSRSLVRTAPSRLPRHP